MRSQEFLRFLSRNYPDPGRICWLADNQRKIRGGWEAWLQVEIAITFVSYSDGWECEREAGYPSGDLNNPWLSYDRQAGIATTVRHLNHASRCDFYLHRSAAQDRPRDDTYFELKCMNLNAHDPVRDAWERFNSDIYKIEAVTQTNRLINGIALLASYGSFAEGVPRPGPNMRAYVWDPTDQNNVSLLANVNRDPTDRFFMVAVSLV